MADKKLINLVRSHDILYKKGSSKHKYYQAKQKAWKHIANAMGATEKACSQRWAFLRKRFIQEYKKSNASPGNEEITWPLLENMLFLKDFILELKNTRNNIIVSEDMILLAPEPSDLNANEEFFCSDVEGPQSSILINTKVSPRNTGEVNNILLEEIKQFQKIVEKPTRDNSTLQAFGEMLTACLSEMPERKRLKAMQVSLDKVMKIKFEPEEFNIEFVAV